MRIGFSYGTGFIILMNNSLLGIIKDIIAKNGENILAEPKRVSAFLADIAREEPKPQKNTFLKCLELGFPKILKNVSEQERDNCKQQLAQRLHEEEGLDLGLCGETIELLAAVLFNKKTKKHYCKKCGKELQENWNVCPYCVTPVEKQENDSAGNAADVMVMDLKMRVSVELGSTLMLLKEMLSMGEGTILELDKPTGEPVDIKVNGKLIAKGEVVVIDENFGVRVTEIFSSAERAVLDRSL